MKNDALRIVAVASRPREIPLSRSYAIASRGQQDAARMVQVRLTAGEHVGLGSATPYPEVTGESWHACCEALDPGNLDWLVGEDALDLPGVGGALHKRLSRTPAARAALDMAAHDLWARHRGLPLVEALGRVHETLLTSITIGIRDAEATLAEAEEYVQRGFRALKIKVGRDLEEDILRLRQLRGRFGDAVAIRVDGNEGYRVEQLPMLLQAAVELDLELVEQPLAPGHEDSLRDAPDNLRSLLAADESLLGTADAAALVREPLPYGIFNIKLMKCGGVREALDIAEIAAGAGIELMWGCMDESVVSIAAALHAALASPNTRYLDLDGSFDLSRDPAVGGFELRGGALRTIDAPGLGCEDAG